MKIKWLWFLIGYLLFYLLVNYSFALPNEFDGISITALLRNSSRGFLGQLSDIALWLIIAAAPYFILVRFYSKKKLYCFLLLTIGIPIASLIRFYIDRLIANYPIPMNVYLFKNSYFLVCFNLYAIVFFFIQYSQYKALEAKELILQNRQSELSFLRSQINPHFLFNSLNNIYSLVYDRSDGALPAIASLSDLLRYMLYDTTEQVPLIKEIDYIKKYIDLQKLRYDESFRIELTLEGDIEKSTIPPLLLIPFVENAFKHGSADDNGELTITIINNDDKFLFHCRNKKGDVHKDARPGIGLDNVRRRLTLLYPDKHLLTIQDKNAYFDVHLTILHER